MKKILVLSFFISVLTSTMFAQVNISVFSHKYGYSLSTGTRYDSRWIVCQEIIGRNYTDYVQDNELYSTDYNYHFLIPVELSTLEGVAKVVVSITNNTTYNSSNPLDISIEVPVFNEDGVMYYTCNGIKRIIKDHRLLIDTNYIAQKSIYTTNTTNSRSFDFKIEAYDESGTVLKTYSATNGIYTTCY